MATRYVVYLVPDCAELQKKLNMYEDPDMLVNLMDLFEDLYRYSSENTAATIIFDTDDPVELHPNRHMHIRSMEIDGCIVFMNRSSGNESDLWTNEIIPALCESYETDEINNFIEIDAPIDMLQDMGIIDR